MEKIKVRKLMTKLILMSIVLMLELFGITYMLIRFWPLIKKFFALSPPPSWLPSLVQPADWFVVRILGILLITFLAGLGLFWKGGDPSV